MGCQGHRCQTEVSDPSEAARGLGSKADTFSNLFLTLPSQVPTPEKSKPQASPFPSQSCPCPGHWWTLYCSLNEQDSPPPQTGREANSKSRRGKSLGAVTHQGSSDSQALWPEDT